MPARPEPYDKAALDRALSPSLWAKDAAGVLARHAAATAALDGDPALRVVRDLAYGAGARQRIDLTGPAGGRDTPCLAFLHGGFWQEGSKAGAGFAARSFAGHGWSHAAIGYTLAPQATLAEILAEIGVALRLLLARAGALGIDPARIVLAGHSAGGHLTAAVLAGMAGRDLAAALAGFVALSGVFDLAPVAASYVNDRLRLTPEEVAPLSPLCARPVADRPLHLVVGAEEPPAFRDQTAALARAWRGRLSRLQVSEVAGRDHFDILDELADPESQVFGAVLAMGGTS